jgi:radical SAM superfamily enzyme YgiQ (UPF0313 family)
MFKLDIVYPNLYYGGVYSLAMIIFYNLVNGMQNWVCERVYLDKGKISSNLIGFTIHYELDYKNILEMLKKNNVSLSKDRKQIVFAGGPCVINNPETLSEYFDFFFVGEAEESMPKVLEAYEEEQNKEKFLELIKDVPGVFVPGKSKKECYTSVQDLDKITYPLYQPLPENIDKTFVFGKAFILEPERGCPYNCKFCSMPTFYKSLRMRSLEKIKEIIDKGTKLNKRNKVIIYSPSFIHKDRKEILKYMIEKKLEFSVPSIKAETIDEEMVSLIPQGGQKTLTLAPECNERLRKSLNKNIKDASFFKVIGYANKHKIKKLRYYFLLGIPGQEQKDLEETVELIKKLKEKFNGKTSVSFNPLVGKPKTQFEGLDFDKKKIKKQAAYIKKELGKIRVKAKVASVSTSEKEYKLAYAKEFSLN